MTSKIIVAVLFCKDYRICTEARKKGVRPPIHNCSQNYYSSSRAMESDGAIKLVGEIFEAYNKKVYIKYFLGDDDSTTRSLLVKKTDKNKGQLPDNYPSDVIFWADVNHRVKCMVKPLFALAQLSDTLSCCKKDDGLRIKRNFGWYF